MKEKPPNKDISYAFLHGYTLGFTGNTYYFEKKEYWLWYRNSKYHRYNKKFKTIKAAITYLNNAA